MVFLNCILQESHYMYYVTLLANTVVKQLLSVSQGQNYTL